MIRILFVLAMLLACPGQVAAKPTLSEPETAVDEYPGEPSEIAEASAAYGRFLVRVGELQLPLQAELSQIQGEWQATIGGGPDRAAQFRQRIAQTLAMMDRMVVELGAVELPDVAVLEFTDDLLPETVISQMIQTNRQLRVVVEGFNPLLDAMNRNDVAAGELAVERMMDGLRLVYESQIVMTRASMAVTPREESSWEAANAELLLFRSAARALAAWRYASRSTRDPSLADDLAELATQLDATQSEGAAKLEAELAGFVAQRDGLSSDADAATRLVFDRAIATLEIQRELFPLVRRLAANLRNAAGSFRNGPVRPAALLALFRHFQTARQEFDAVGTRMVTTLAGGE